MNTANLSKQQLRDYVRRQKRLRTPEELRQLSHLKEDRLLAHPRILHAQIILLYYSLPDEVCTHQAVELLTAQGKTILLPRVVDGERMEIRRYTGPVDLSESSYHIMEPTGPLFTSYREIEVVVVPGMAFDRHNHRLGRGRGYYDRFLKLVPQAWKLGICFDFQLFDTIPAGPYDVPMDEIIG